MKHALAVVASLWLAGCGGAGGGAAPAAPGSFGKAEGGVDGRRFLGEDADKAKKAGAADSEVVAVDAGAPGDRISGLVNVPENDCVLLIARASQTVDDVDLFVYGDDGTAFGSDEAPNKTPSLLVCPPHPKRLFAVARIAAGHGMVAVGAQRVARRDAAAVGKALDARGRPGEAAGRVAGWPGLDESIADHRRALGGTWQEVRRTALPVDARIPSRASAVVDAERCLDLLVLPSDEVSHLDIAVLDESGRIVGRGVASGRERFAVVCSRTKENITLEVRPQAGRGIAAVVMARSKTPTLGELPPDAMQLELSPLGDLKATSSQLEETLANRGYGKAKTLASGSLTLGQRTSSSVTLPAGCNRIDVVGGRPLIGLKAWLWAADGALLARGEDHRQVTLFACGGGGSGRLDVEPLTRPGPYAAQLRAEGAVAPVLVKHPLAASRLLDRMAARGVLRRGNQAGAPQEMLVDDAHRRGIDVLVPIGRCVDVDAALGPGATGVELRAVDSESADELELSAGSESAALRICALDSGRTLKARVEITVGVGSTTALVATRMLSPRP